MRQELVRRLRRGPANVATLAANLPVSRPAVSQHLGVLRAAGLVTARREGTSRVYGLSPEALGALRAEIEATWRDALAAFTDHAKGERHD